MTYGAIENPASRQVITYSHIPQWDQAMLGKGAGGYTEGSGVPFSRDHTFVRIALLSDHINGQLDIAHQRDQEIERGVGIRSSRLEEIKGNLDSLQPTEVEQTIAQERERRKAGTNEQLSRLQRFMERASRIEQQLRVSDDQMSSKWDEVRSAFIGIQNELTDLEQRVKKLQGNEKP